MSRVACHLSISLDGLVAGPNQSLENPLGEGGLRLHEWIFATAAWHRAQGLAPVAENEDDPIVSGLMAPENVGAYVMGRNMFGPIRGEWDLSWKGWWGDDPPYHVPVFVLTHHARDPVTMQGGTTFNFVTDGIESALRQSLKAAHGKDVQVGGGASTVRQFLRAGYLDELYLDIVPIVLGRGERLFEDVGDPTMTPVSVTASPAVTHVRYRIDHQ